MFPRKVDHEDPFLAVWRLISSGNALLGITSGLSPIRTELHFRGNFRVGGYTGVKLSKSSVRQSDYIDKWNIDLCRDRHRKVVPYRN